MKISPRPHHNSTTADELRPPPQQQPNIINISESTNPYPTTFVQADTSSFKQVVQMLTGSTPNPASKTHIPPINSIPKRQQSSFKLYERRNVHNDLKISPLLASVTAGFSPRNQPEIVSPSILDFPSLVLSPVTPLLPDPFGRSQPSNCEPLNNVSNSPAAEEEAEAKAIREKGFYLHSSPATTPRESKLKLLPLFPTTSPRDQQGSSTS